jgi:putative transposase
MMRRSARGREGCRAGPSTAGSYRGREGDRRWSSYRHYAFGEPNDLIDDAPAYLRLGATAVQRRIAYRNLCDEPLAQDQDTPEALVTSLFIGDLAWIEERLVATGRRRRCHDPPASKSKAG